MVLLPARLKRNSLPPAPRPAKAGPLHTVHAPVAPKEPADAAAAAAGDEGDEAIWHGAPVFDAGHWLAAGGLELVREMHDTLGAEAEALTAAGVAAGAAEWVDDCLALGWPRARVIDIEYDACAAQPDPTAVRWLQMAQDTTLFPQVRLFRLTARWAGCTEVFEHPIRGPLGRGLAQRLALLDQLPTFAGDRELEMRFCKYRALFLVGVSFEMGAMAQTDAGSMAMYTYITYLLKTDLFAPTRVELVDAQPKHIHSVLMAINANTHHLAYDRMRTTTSAAALQSSLQHLCLDMHTMVDGRSRIIFCAAHFPRLESLVVRHTPDFRLPHADAMNLGVLFSLPWSALVDLTLPFISDQLAATLHTKCPLLRYLSVLPGPRYERWAVYAQTFSPDGLHALATQWPALRQLVVRHAFRQALAGDSPEGAQPGSRLSALMGKASAVKPLSPDSPSSAPKDEALPGTWVRTSFAFHPKHRQLRVLRAPYLRLTFATAMATLVDVPGLAVLEFTPTLSDPAPMSIVASTLRRRMSISPSPQLNAPFADSSTVYQLGALKHPLESLVLHEACSRRYITSSWIQIMNTFAQLAAVTFVATSQEDMAIVERVGQFCARNGALFAVEADDCSREHQTCLDFATSWSSAGGIPAA